MTMQGSRMITMRRQHLGWTTQESRMMEEEHSMQREHSGAKALRCEWQKEGEKSWDPVGGGGSEAMRSEAEEQVPGNHVGK